MMGANRPSSIAATLTTLALCLAPCGCISPYGENFPGQGGQSYSNYTPPQSVNGSGSSNTPGYSASARQGVRQVKYQQPDGEVFEPQMKDGQKFLPGPGPNCPIGPNPGPLPVEKIQVSHPPYRVAPPDILYIDALRMVPKPPYRIEPLEVLIINVTDTLPNEPIAGQATVSPEGSVNLGFKYGSVRIGGLTLDQASEAIRQHLSNSLRNHHVSVGLLRFEGMQQVRGQHLVRPDGTIGLGTYGSVYVAGLTLDQVKWVVEKHLSNFLLDPVVSVDVFAYNSNVFYIIFDGAGYGQQVFRLPVTGNETVLDAISRVQGLPPVASRRLIWLARPTPPDSGCSQIKPVDWDAITQAGSTATNYQIFPGDRIFVQSNPWVKTSNRLRQVLDPIEQLMGVTFLGANTVLGVKTAINPTLGTTVVP